MTKKLVEKHGFEPIPFRDATPEEQVSLDNIVDFLNEAESLLGIYNPELNVEELLATLLILNTSTESK